MVRIFRDLVEKRACQAPPSEALKGGPDGTLWVITGRGLARLRKNSFETAETGAAAQDLRALDVGADGKIYLGFDRGLLVGVAPPGGDMPVFALAPNAPHEQVNGILAESDGGVWFSCGSQLCLLDHSRVQIFDKTYGLPPERWGVMLRDRAGNLWVRGPQHLYVLPRGETRFRARDRDLPQSSNSALSLAEDRQGRMLVADRPGSRPANRRSMGIDRYRPGAAIGDRDLHPGRSRRVNLAWPLGQRCGAMAGAR